MSEIPHLDIPNDSEPAKRGLRLSVWVGAPIFSCVIAALAACALLIGLLVLRVQREAMENRELDVVLPAATPAVPLNVSPIELFITVKADGHLYVDDAEVSTTEFRRMLETPVADNPYQSVIIRVDKQVPFKSIVSVMDLCRQTGKHNYCVMVDQQE